MSTSLPVSSAWAQQRLSAIAIASWELRVTHLVFRMAEEVWSVDGFNLVVPEMKHTDGEFGLDLEGRINHIDVYRSGHGHRWGTNIEDPRKRLSHLPKCGIS